jgi:hypothetical protein
MRLRNVGIFIPHYTGQHFRRQLSSYSPPREPEISPGIQDLIQIFWNYLCENKYCLYDNPSHVRVCYFVLGFNRKKDAKNKSQLLICREKHFSITFPVISVRLVNSLQSVTYIPNLIIKDLLTVLSLPRVRVSVTS